MVTLPESGSVRGFFLSKDIFLFPQLPYARSGWGIGSKRSFAAICWFPWLGYCFLLAFYV